MQVLNIYFEDIKNSTAYEGVSQNYIKEKIFKKKEFKVNSFHNYGITNSCLAKTLKFLLKTPIIILKCKHKRSKVYGFMWHPEREKNTKDLDFIINKILKR